MFIFAVSFATRFFNFVNIFQIFLHPLFFLQLLIFLVLLIIYLLPT